MASKWDHRVWDSRDGAFLGKAKVEPLIGLLMWHGEKFNLNQHMFMEPLLCASFCANIGECKIWVKHHWISWDQKLVAIRHSPNWWSYPWQWQELGQQRLWNFLLQKTLEWIDLFSIALRYYYKWLFKVGASPNGNKIISNINLEFKR